MYKIGLDLGSTTIKAVVIDNDGKSVFTRYERHNAKIIETLFGILEDIKENIGTEESVSVGVTGSVGMGIAEKCGVPFVQEVVAATKAIKHKGLNVSTMIDIGGEDAKIVFFGKDGKSEELRMNGNCSGGTGAFIDQMSVILGEDIGRMNELAEKATKIYPIASRCGVFCKTDIQNLVAKGASKEDISASVFRAVVIQTIVTLAHGCDIKPPILMCGGPLTYIPALRNAYYEYLSLKSEDIILPEDSSLLPALGTAVGHDVEECRLNDITERIKERLSGNSIKASTLPPLFNDEKEQTAWRERVESKKITEVTLKEGYMEGYLGIDSGSTTTKVVVIDKNGSLIFSHYSPNSGKPVKAVSTALGILADRCIENGTMLNILSACSTGYGEDLIKAAFSLEHGIIETVAHFLAAKYIDPEVTFILDIGGQDMKAIYADNGVINRIEINEACSSGCGSFLETFAKSTGHTIEEFAKAACRAKSPCDLGTRCTVFMNSKVKQVLREGYTSADIAAGLAYSVIKNCLYKVLKVKNIATLGKHIVVQGGTMKNDAVVKALETLSGAKVSRSNIPELMGAYGCAIYALEHCCNDRTVENCRLPKHLVDNALFTSKTTNCRGCENSCLVTAYRFNGGKRYYSGNRCERVFNNAGEKRAAGENIYEYKYKRVFSTDGAKREKRQTIGIPRCLNIYEDYPFWDKLFREAGFNVELSGDSNYSKYEHDAKMVMSDNICFPAKVVHSHISELQKKGVDRIFFPFVVHNRQNGGENSYNCPIVTGYTEVIRNVHKLRVAYDSPTFSMKETKLFKKQCCHYLATIGVGKREAERAFEKAIEAVQEYEKDIAAKAAELLERSKAEGKTAILLAGRPYHSDPLIQHDIAGMIASLGVNVISEDIVRLHNESIDDVNFVSQWSYTNRILQAAKWCAAQGEEVQFVQMTSFGCGPDAFLTDAVRDILLKKGKTYTLLKLDDINNVGSMKLRVRSLIDSLMLAGKAKQRSLATVEEPQIPVYEEKHKERTIIIPYFTPFISPLLPAIMKHAGYKVENLPMSDEKSAEYGLMYANNEVCYPATLVVGDIIKGLKEGGYKADEVAVAMTQTGGQCRASNYLPLIKKALIDAGFSDTPVISVGFSSGIRNEQPGFKIDWLNIIPVALYSLLFSDSIAKMYYATAAREKEKGKALMLKEKYLNSAAELLGEGKRKALLPLISEAAREFNEACIDKETKKAGVVGEIYLKFNPFAHRHIIDRLADNGIEIAPPMLLDFFTQYFVNRKTKKAGMTEKGNVPEWIYTYIYRLFRKHVSYFNSACREFRFWSPFDDIFKTAERAEEIINMHTLFGEGWLLPAEIASYYKENIKNVISLQPFGCIANHIVVRGIEKRLKALFPQLNLLSLDFDGGVSDVNVTNRLLLFMDNMK